MMLPDHGNPTSGRDTTSLARGIGSGVSSVTEVLHVEGEGGRSPDGTASGGSGVEGLTVTISIHLNGTVVPVILEPDALAAIAAALPSRSEGESPWLAGAQAAAYHLGWPRERVYKRLRDLPHFREEGRLMFKRAELDAWIEGCREH